MLAHLKLHDNKSWGEGELNMVIFIKEKKSKNTVVRQQ
jgi:hypothetical protein